MPLTTEGILKRPLYVFDLPQELLDSIAPKEGHLQHAQTDCAGQISGRVGEKQDGTKDSSQVVTACVACQASFDNVKEQRQHGRSDWHSYNVRQRVRGGETVSEGEFEKLIDGLDESISGSGSGSSESEDEGQATKTDALSALLRKQAVSDEVVNDDEGDATSHRTRGAGRPPIFWFRTPLVPPNVSLGVYRALFTNAEQVAPSIVQELRSKQLQPVSVKQTVTNGPEGGAPVSVIAGPSIFMCMIGGGHFAGMIVSLSPRLSGPSSTGAEQRQAIVIAHKTFHRYTTRRKQGGGQSANDAAKGAAHSAGSSLRRYNEVALEQEIRVLLSEWRELIKDVQLIFVRATGSSNRRILFGPYDGQVLRHNDPRNRTFPFSTRRATQAELMRSFVELTRIKVSHVDETALAGNTESEALKAKSKPIKHVSQTVPKKISQEDETAALHTNQLQALIRRSKVPAMLSYLSTHALQADYKFHPSTSQANHHAPTPLHLASSINSAPIILALLTKAAADPTTLNNEGRPAFDLTGDRASRDAFRVARSILGESRWSWETAHVPSAITKADAEARDAREKLDSENLLAERRKFEEEKLRETEPMMPVNERHGKPLGVAFQVPKTAEEKRQEEGRGMSVEMRAKLERERRARAAEARLRGPNR